MKVKFVSEKKGTTTDELHAFIIEDEDKLAARCGGKIIKTDLIRPKQIERNNFFAIGNFRIFNWEY